MAADNRTRVQPERRPAWPVWLVAVLGFLLLLAPVLPNRSIILFPDSMGYFHAGEAAVSGVYNRTFHGGRPPALRQGPNTAATIDNSPTLARRADDGVSTARSVYYGAGFYVLNAEGGGWALAAVQALMTLTALLFGIPRLVGASRNRTLAVIAILATIAGLGVFVGTAMPDVFTGMMLMALAILFVEPAGMSRWERLLWLLLVLAAALFHKAHLAMATVLAVLYLVGAIARLWPLRRLGAPAAMLGLALAGHLAVDAAVTRMLGVPPAQTPFVLARIVADGTASMWLAKHCGDPDPVLLCKWQARFPMNETYFLWSPDRDRGFVKVVTPAELAQVNVEAGRVIIGTVSEFPVAQLRASLSNFAAQLVSVGVEEFSLGPRERVNKSPAAAPMMQAWPNSAIGRGTYPLRAISIVMLIVYLAGFAILAASAPPMRRARDAVVADRRAIIAWLVAGVITNAAVSSIIAGVYPRYQGRVVWIIVLAALAVLAMRYDARRGLKSAAP